MVHCHTMHLPLGALLTWRTMCGAGLYAGVAGGVVAGLAAMGLLGCFCCWKKKQARAYL